MKTANERTLSFLKKNYHPFTHFTDEMMNQAAGSLRFFDIRAGESLNLQATSVEDYLYVLEGSALFRFEDSDEELMVNANSKQSLAFSRDQSPVQISSDVSTTLCHAESALVNDFLSLKELSNSVAAEYQDAFMQRLLFLKSTRAFSLLPLNVVEEAAHRCEEVEVEKGTDVIIQDMKGDNFYVILSGQAEVWREELEDDEPQMVSILEEGDGFGEEALVTGGARNATVRMISDGRLLQLSKTDFEELVKVPAIRSVTPDVAKAMLSDGAQIIDVRYAEEYEESFIPGSVLMPLPELRSHIPELEKDKEYLVLCAAGVRAAAATLLLRQQDIKARFIEGGIKKWPFGTSQNLDLELILFDFCPYAQRAVISLNEQDIPHKLTYLDPDNLPDWFEDVSPFGKVPVLRVDGTTTVFESSVINELIAQLSTSQMLPSNPVERSLCRSWIEFGSTLLGQVTAMLSVENEADFIEARNALRLNLQRLEEQLEGRGPYFTGDQFSLVDSTYAPLFMRMRYLNEYLPLFDETEFPLISAWADNLLSMESVRQSTRDDFGSIYRAFVKRRGEGGFVDRSCAGAA